MRARGVAGAACLACALCALPRSSAADAATDARFFDARGRAAFARRAWQSALEDFLLVQDVAPSARNLYNVALCADAASRPDLAFGFFEEYLAGDDPDEGRRAHARERVDALRRGLALVEVTSDPPGATISVDRAELGSMGLTPRVLALDPGAHVVLLEREGHRPTRLEVEARVGELRAFAATLEALTGTLQLEAVPEFAALVVLGPGGEVARGRGRLARTLPVGPYRVRLEVDGAAVDETSLRVREGATESVRLVAPARAAPTGRVLVSTGGVRATVEIDGTARGSSPLAVPRVPAGRHRVRITALGYRPWQGEVVVERDRTRHVDVSLVRR